MAGTGRLVAGGAIVGLGFALTTRLAVTARHVIDELEPTSLEFVPEGAPHVPVTAVQGDPELDIAILTLAWDVPTSLRWADARRRATWTIEARWLPNDPILTGTVTAPRVSIVLAGGTGAVEAVQLHVDQRDLGTFHGYSGSPVLDDDERVVGVLVEQVADRRSERDFDERVAASSVMWAVPIRDVVERFSVATLKSPAGDEEVTRLQSTVSIAPDLHVDVVQWVQRHVFSHEPRSLVEGLEFSPDGALLATSGTDRTVRLWDLAADAPLGAPLEHAEAVRQPAFSGDASRLATCTETRVAVWDVAELGRPAWGHDHATNIRDFAFGATGRLLAIAAPTGVSLLWDLTEGEATTLDRHVYRVALSSDGRRLATCSFLTGARLWRLADGMPCQPVPVRVAEGAKVERLSFSRSGRWLLVVAAEPEHGTIRADTQRTVRVHDAYRGTHVGAVRHDSAVNQVLTSADDQLVASASDDRTVRVWRTGASADPVELRQSDRAIGVGIGPRSSFVVVAGHHPEVTVWHLDDPPSRGVLRHDTAVGAVAVSVHGLVATASDEIATVWSRTPDG